MDPGPPPRRVTRPTVYKSNELATNRHPNREIFTVQSLSTPLKLWCQKNQVPTHFDEKDLNWICTI
jgi:hypothetical protein